MKCWRIYSSGTEMSLRCAIGIHDYNEWRCTRCHKENPRLTKAREDWERKQEQEIDDEVIEEIFGKR